MSGKTEIITKAAAPVEQRAVREVAESPIGQRLEHAVLSIPQFGAILRQIQSTFNRLGARDFTIDDAEEYLERTTGTQPSIRTINQNGNQRLFIELLPTEFKLPEPFVVDNDAIIDYRNNEYPSYIDTDDFSDYIRNLELSDITYKERKDVVGDIAGAIGLGLSGALGGGLLYGIYRNIKNKKKKK